MKQQDLVQVLGHLPDCATSPDVIVDRDLSDDAAVVQGTGASALVLTADIIAPIVDDPTAFGAIAASNALSDVWAMGGVPRFALALAFFPEELPLEVLTEILRGGADTCARAGVAVVGGHTVRDPELKYGLSVTGEVTPGAVLSNRTARAGDALVLTKALGTGVIGQAIKKQLASEAEAAAAIASMTTLNGPAIAIARGFDVHACTDVTGFGLFGHLRNVLRASKLAARVDLASLPLLPGARRHAEAGVLPGGSRANREFAAPHVRGSVSDDVLLALANDAQTSGGLLLCLPPERADAAVEALRAIGLPAARIGGLFAGDLGTIEI